MARAITTSVYISKKEKTIWLHCFLNAAEQITTKVTKQKGIREFKVFGKGMNIVVGDVIVKWGDKNQIKTVHRVIGNLDSDVFTTCTPIKGTGTMEDVILLNSLPKKILKCIQHAERVTYRK